MAWNTWSLNSSVASNYAGTSNYALDQYWCTAAGSASLAAAGAAANQYNWIISGNSADNTIYANVGATNGMIINGGTGNETIYATVANTTINGGVGNDHIFASAANAYVIYDSNDKVDVHATGTNSILDASGSSVGVNIDLTGSVTNGFTKVVGSALADTIIANSQVSNTTLVGGGGADTLKIAGATSTNNVWFVYDAADTLVNGANAHGILDASAQTAGATIYEGSTFKNLYEIIGGAGNDDLRGDGTLSVLVGGAGDDNLWAGDMKAAGSVITSAQLTGGAGNDTFWVGAGEGTVNISYDGSAANSAGDTVNLYTVSAYDLVGKASDHVVIGTSDVTIYTNNTKSVASEVVLQGAAGNSNAVHQFVSSEGWKFNMIFGKSGAQSTLNGYANQIDNIYAGDSGDTIDGKGGNDNLYGGAGADTFVYHAGDKVYAGKGKDVIDASAQTTAVSIHLDDSSYLAADDSSDLITDGLSIKGSKTATNDLRGAAKLSATLTGGSAADYIWGGSGVKADTLVGNGGADTFYYGINEGDDVIAAGTNKATGTAASTVDFYNVTDINTLTGVLNGNDLVLTISGGAGSLTVQNWNGSDKYNQLSTITLGTGTTATNYTVSVDTTGKASFAKK